MRNVGAFFLSVILCVVGVGIFVYGSHNQFFDFFASEDSPGEIPYTVLVSGITATAIESQTNYRIVSQEEFEKLWAMVFTDGIKVPYVDFSKKEVFAVFDGTHTTQGYGISVEAVTDTATARLVSIRHRIPANSCTLMSKVTAPFQMIVVPKSTLKIMHTDIIEASSCIR